MTLIEISEEYEHSAQLLRKRLQVLRAARREAVDSEVLWHLDRRIAELEPILTQMNDLAELTAHYYDRGYWRSEYYTF